MLKLVLTRIMEAGRLTGGRGLDVKVSVRGECQG